MFKKLLLGIGLCSLALGSLFHAPLTAFAQEDMPDDVVLEEDIERPEWQTMPLTDARTGETFTLGDFYGKTVYVEPMATWCTNCRARMRTVIELIETLEEENIEDVVFIGLSVEVNLNPQRLADYVDGQGFDWTFAVAPPEILALFVDEFGRAALNPPSTPHWYIRADGTYTEMFTGPHDEDELKEQILQAQEDSAATLIIEGESPEATPEPTEETVAQVERPDWHSLELVDATTGETYTLADFAGKTVYVEPMATWCGNCRAQLQNVRTARESVGDEVVFVAFSVETNLSDADLAAYAESQGFDWTFSVASPELLAALVDQFGRAIINPPSTPHFLILPDGSMTEANTGIESAEAIVAWLTGE